MVLITLYCVRVITIEHRKIPRDRTKTITEECVYIPEYAMEDFARFQDSQNTRKAYLAEAAELAYLGRSGGEWGLGLTDLAREQIVSCLSFIREETEKNAFGAWERTVARWRHVRRTSPLPPSQEWHGVWLVLYVHVCKGYY